MNLTRSFVIARTTAEIRSAGHRCYLELELSTAGLTVRTMGVPKRAWTVPGLWAGWRAFESLSNRIVESKTLDGLARRAA